MKDSLLGNAKYFRRSIVITEEYVIRAIMPRRVLLATTTLAKVLVRIGTVWARSWIVTTSNLLGLDPKSPRIGSNAKLYLIRQVFSQTRKKLSLK